MANVVYTAVKPAGKILELFEHVLEQGDTLKVRNQDQTTQLFQYFLMRHLDENIKLASPVNIDDNTITLVAGHSFSAGEWVVIWENNYFEQVQVDDVNGNVITISIPVANPFTVNAKVVRGTTNMAIDASTEVDFLFKPLDCNIPIDIEGVVISIQSGNDVPDDGKFGGIAALTNGMYFRQMNGERVNLGWYKTNSDFKLRGGAVSYDQKAPGGTYGTNVILSIKDSYGVVIRICDKPSDHILCKLRDNMASLSGMFISIMGQFTLEE